MKPPDNLIDLTAQSAGSRPWHREPYVWLLIVIPGIALIAGAVTVYLALHGADVELPHPP